MILMSTWSLLTSHGTVDFHFSEHFKDFACRLAKSWSSVLTLEASSWEDVTWGVFHKTRLPVNPGLFQSIRIILGKLCSMKFKQPDLCYHGNLSRLVSVRLVFRFTINLKDSVSLKFLCERFSLLLLWTWVTFHYTSNLSHCAYCVLKI